MYLLVRICTHRLMPDTELVKASQRQILTWLLDTVRLFLPLFSVLALAAWLRVLSRAPAQAKEGSASAWALTPKFDQSGRAGKEDFIVPRPYATAAAKAEQVRIGAGQQQAIQAKVDSIEDAGRTTPPTLPSTSSNTSIMADTEVRQKRTFKKYTYRGVEVGLGMHIGRLAGLAGCKSGWRCRLASNRGSEGSSNSKRWVEQDSSQPGQQQQQQDRNKRTSN
jgi:hypothetical protein